MHKIENAFLVKVIKRIITIDKNVFVGYIINNKNVFDKWRKRYDYN